MGRAHAILSPSASHRWLHCTAAPSLEEKLPEETSMYAEEGTLAHAICEAKLHEYLGDGKAEDYFRRKNGIDWTEHELYKSEMEDTSDYYRDVVAEKFKIAEAKTPDALLLIEVQLDFSRWIPEGFGTADAVIIGDGKIDVIDYKHGKGVKVESFMNPQMMTYAIGACEKFGFEYKLDMVSMTIVQPRIDNTSTWEIPYANLMDWGNDVLTPKAKEAYNGVLGCDTVTEVGEWCRFCKARKICKARAEQASTLITYGDPRLLEPSDVARYLPMAAAVESWCKDIEEHAMALMLEGTEVEGYKVVEGRSLRKITNPEALVKVLADNGYNTELFYKAPALRSLGELEKLVGKAQFAELAKDYIEKPQGAPTIALAADKRKPYSKVENDFSHIIND